MWLVSNCGRTRGNGIHLPFLDALVYTTAVGGLGGTLDVRQMHDLNF